jgi:hypothetical protein
MWRKTVGNLLPTRLMEENSRQKTYWLKVWNEIGMGLCYKIRQDIWFMKLWGGGAVC